MTERTGIEWTDATWNPVRGAQEATSKDYWQAGESVAGIRNIEPAGARRRGQAPHDRPSLPQPTP